MAGKTRLDRARRLEETDTDAAVELYRQHLEKTPADSDAWLRLAKVLEQRGEPGPAAAAFEGLAEAQAAAGFRIRAIASLHQALRLTPGNAPVGLRIADLLVAERKPADAAALLRGLAGSLPQGVIADSIEVWTRLVELQPRSDATVRLAELLAASGQREAAADRLRTHAADLVAASREADALAALERALALAPGHARAAESAARLALKLGEPRRALATARGGLDGAPDDPDLIALAAASLERLGEHATAALLYRTAAEHFGALGRPDDEEAAWRSVLRFDPDDPRGREAIAPLFDADEVEEDAPSVVPLRPGTGTGMRTQPARTEPSGTGTPGTSIPEFEIEIELALHVPAARIVPDLQVTSLDAGWDDADSSPDLTPPGTPPPSAPSPRLAERPAAFVADAPSVRTPLSIVPAAAPAARPSPLPADAAGAIAPQVHRALVVGEGPEAGWWRRALHDHGLECFGAGSDELDAAVARAHEARCDAVIVPAELADAWRAAGGWLVVATTLPAREELDAGLRTRGVAVIERRPVPTVDDLKRVLEAWGSPLELVGVGGVPLRVTGAAAPAYVHAVAKQKLGPPLFAQPVTDATVEVAIAAGARRAIGLAAWTREAGDLAGVASIDESAEAAALALAAEAATALGLVGLATCTLARVRDRLVVESIGPLGVLGALLVEARTGLSLPIIALELARGAPPPYDPVRRGHARAVRTLALPADPGGVRVEPAIDGVGAGAGALIVASGATAAICERTLRRAIGGGTVVGAGTPP